MKSITARLITGMLVSSILTIVASAATTNDCTVGGTAMPAGAKTPKVLTGTCNFLTTPAAAGDVYKVVTIPKNFMVMGVTAMCVTTNTGTASAFLVGDGTATNTYVTSAISMVLPEVLTQNANTLANGGNLYTSANFISVVPTIAVTNGSVKVNVLGVQF